MLNCQNALQQIKRKGKGGDKFPIRYQVGDVLPLIA